MHTNMRNESAPRQLHLEISAQSSPTTGLRSTLQARRRVVGITFREHSPQRSFFARPSCTEISEYREALRAGCDGPPDP